MSPRSLALAAGPVVAAALLAWSLRQPPDSRRASLPRPQPAPGPVDVASPPTLPAIAIEPAGGLPPEDAEWVRGEAARYLAAHDLSPQEQQRLVQQLVSIRQFEVLERQEPYPPQEEP